MRFMHSRCYIHQDLNPSNILINGEGRALISDFGSSRSESVDITPTSSGTDQYGAPEIFYSEDWTRQVDVYSFGLILYEILIGSPVFGDKEDSDNVIEKKLSGYIPEMGSRVSSVVNWIIKACLRSDPSLRPSFACLFHLFDQFGFALVPGIDKETVWEYVKAVTDWELSASCTIQAAYLTPDATGALPRPL
jgi:serine/threonine protein kinase